MPKKSLFQIIATILMLPGGTILAATLPVSLYALFQGYNNWVVIGAVTGGILASFYLVVIDNPWRRLV